MLIQPDGNLRQILNHLGGEKKIRFTLPLYTCWRYFIFSVDSNRHVVPIERGWHIPVYSFWIPTYFCESVKSILLDWFKGDIFQKISEASNIKNLCVEATFFLFFYKSLNVSCQKGERPCRDKQLKLPLWCVDSNPQIVHRCWQWCGVGSENRLSISALPNPNPLNTIQRKPKFPLSWRNY